MECGWLYLHFLDRELLTTCGLYGNLCPRRVQDDFIVSLLSVMEPSYLSTSVLFESDHAFGLFSKYGAVFSRQDLLRLAGAHDHLGGFISRKRDDYAEHKLRYARYFTDSWKSVEDAAPRIAVKRQDTTRFLQRRVQQRLIGLAALLDAAAPGAPAGGARSLVERLTSTLERSGNTPVTSGLFESVFRESTPPQSWRYQANLQISLAYVESYMNDYGGAIPTHLSCGLRVFDGLSRTFPVHCLEVWREIYTALGVYPRVLAVPAEDLVRIREMDLHRLFVEAVRRLLDRDHGDRATPATRDVEDGAYDVWRLSQGITRWLPRCSFDESISFVGFVERALRAAVTRLDERHASERGSVRCPPNHERQDEPTYYLDVQESALKGSDGRVITVDDGVARVLLALVGEVPGSGRGQPLGKLSDGAVASLYTGSRRERSPEESAKIAYQFTRALRRNLSRAGLRERDAIVRRLRGRGVAMGTKWARSPVRGKSEVGLVLGRLRDVAAATRDDSDDRR